MCRVYWTCHREKHRHMTEATAASCLLRHPDPPVPPRKKWTLKQMLEIQAMHESGMTWADIGKLNSLSGSRMSQLAEKGTRLLRYGMKA